MPGHLLDLVLPPRCPGCGATVAGQGRFCASCWLRLRFLAPPWCAGCNLPFAFDRGEGARCATCLADPPGHAGVRAAVAYGEIARTVALRLKYGGRPFYAATMAALMQRHLPIDATCLVPVPLHRRRIWSRGYNQAAMIASELARRAQVPVALHALERHRATPPLRDRSARERRATVAGAFRVAPGGRTMVRGASLVLVDDVYTSGATAEACVKVLRAAGAASVTILAWARVIEDATD
ncbi:ComF family protein [Sphingomonas sp. 8AM]|uniref:ComF family protein n=1 Tax=Sphingomonas sp. 8AM TaxID=2653170 RepID=UPI0012EF3E46|nr:ComF family protein [Sphingomonas sp. 8AM]VXD04257.1 Amidophosphoribosyltransferase [Sphingomonas sp. 8AM]